MFENLLWVAGGRDYTDRHHIRSVLIDYDHTWTLITGGARGCDLIAEQIWREMEKPYVGIPARWAMYQRSAGPRRNRLIGDLGPKVLLAFPGGSGTEDAIDVAEGLGIEVRKQR